MKKILAIIITVVMTVSAFALCANAADATPITVDLSGANGSSVTVDIKDGKVACTTNGGDPWVSIPLDEIDTSVYKFFTITYTATEEIGSNNTYLMDTEVNKGYSPIQGTWCGHGMAGTADGAKHTKTYSIEADFPAMVGTKLTGVRFTCCNENTTGTFTVESVVFHATETIAEGTNPGTADAAVIAIAAVACIALAGVVVAKKVK